MKRRSIGVALAGGGPLGAIYEIGALMALDEALRGVSLKACDVYVGVSSGAFFAAGLANGVLPRWFAILTLVLGVLSALGTAGIPPGGLVNYLLLPLWLIAAAIILVRRQGEGDLSLSLKGSVVS